MENPVPYFSELTADIRKEVSTNYRSVKKAPIFLPHLGLPCRKKFSSVGCRPLSKQHFLAPAESVPAEKSQKSESILSQVETPTIIEKQLTEINQPNFLSLAAQNTFEGLAKVAQKKVSQLNPLQSVKNQKPCRKRRKLDIFDL